MSPDVSREPTHYVKMCTHTSTRRQAVTFLMVNCDLKSQLVGALQIDTNSVFLHRWSPHASCGCLTLKPCGAAWTFLQQEQHVRPLATSSPPWDTMCYSPHRSTFGLNSLRLDLVDRFVEYLSATAWGQWNKMDFHWSCSPASTGVESTHSPITYSP